MQDVVVGKLDLFILRNSQHRTEQEASCLAKKGFSQREIDGDGRILSSWGKSIEKKSGRRQNAAWIRLQKQSWLAERIWLWEAQTTLHSLAESTWVAENRNCTVTAWAKGLQTWVLAADAHTQATQGWAVLLHIPWSEQCDWLFSVHFSLSLLKMIA